MAVSTIIGDANAQAPTQNKRFTAVTRYNNAGTPVSRDTITNAETGSIGHRVTYAYDLSFNYTITRLSGTLAGSSVLKGTNDTTLGPWHTVKGDTTQCSTCVVSTATLTNAATNTFTWRVKSSPFVYYRIQTTTTGTVTATHDLVTDYKY